MGVELRVKINFGLVHMNAARDFAKKCRMIEEDQKHLDWPQPRYQEAARYALGAVILSVAAIEAGINETYLTMADNVGRAVQQLPADKVRLLAILWDQVEPFPTLKKYQIALVACGQRPFDPGLEPYQSAQDLTRVRNALIHFKPEWDNDSGDHAKLEARLKNRFQETQTWKRAKGARKWFPDRCLGAGCAEWACNTAKSLHDEFCKRLGLKPVLG